jgi:starvation-inducible DNA-binding protein
MSREINTGISESDRKRIAEGLGRMLADTYTLYLKTHNYHWNVTGPRFKLLHDFFEEQYNELAEAADDVAERIRQLGHPAPGSYRQFSSLTGLAEAPDELPEADEMVRQLADDHETVVKTARSVLPIAEEGNDEVTVDFLIERMSSHEKTAWMLRSSL